MIPEEPLAELRFGGARYRHHVLDRAALNEAGRFLEIAEDFAALLWRRTFPEMPTPSASYLEKTRLYAQTVRPGSAVVPFSTVSEDDVQPELPLPLNSGEWPTTPEILEHLLRAFERDGRNTLYLESLPAKLLTKTGSLGRELVEGSSCVLAVQGRDNTLIDSKVRERILSVANACYEDSVDITGTVTRVNLKTQECGIETRDGTSLALRFPSGLEEKITRALQEHQSTMLRITGRGEYHPSGTLKSLIGWEAVSLEPIGASEESRQSAEAVLDRLFSDLDPEAWRNLPPNLAEDHDIYISGSVTDE